MAEENMTYNQAGVNIDAADAAKREMAEALATPDPRVLHRHGAFAALFEASFPGMEHPVLVLKVEEPGSKQLLAFQHGRLRGICYDLVNHLVNDIVVMGAHPQVVLDVILCGKLETPVIVETVKWIAQACREQDCTLVGGETSEQPRVLPAGSYMLAASIVGVVDRDKIVDGSAIQAGDTVLALASNGVHTNGYSLVRRLMEADPKLEDSRVEGESFLDAILRPHRCYYQGLRDLLGQPGLHGLAHITGGGIRDNLMRILPPGVNACIDLGKIRTLPVFRAIRQAGRVADLEMLRVFNLGVGMIAVMDPAAAGRVQAYLEAKGYETYPIGEIEPGDQAVVVEGELRW